MKRRCAICGRDGEDVAARITEMAPAHRPPFQVIDRCKDSVGCRERAEALGEDWPVFDAVAAALEAAR